MVLEAYGAKAVSDIQFYEYKLGQDEWKQMKNNKLEISKDFDELVISEQFQRLEEKE